jgi:sporulation protein YlmC with PRC-barrel domain
MNVLLVRDVLDKQLVDNEDEEMGRVDGLVIQYGEKTQPRITHIEIGGATLGARLSPFFARLAKKLSQLWGPRRKEPVRIAWSRVETLGRNIKLAVEATDTGAIDWEIWIARHIIERIPGGGHEDEGDGS